MNVVRETLDFGMERVSCFKTISSQQPPSPDG